MPHFKLKPCEFGRWLRFDSWPIEQAAFILLGHEPPPLDYLRSGKPLIPPESSYGDLRCWDQPRGYGELLRLLENSISNKSLPHQRITIYPYDTRQVVPDILLEWAEQKNISVPRELAEQVRATTRQRQSINPRSEIKIDYSPFLDICEDGNIWWRRDEAIKLGAGYLPIRDDRHDLNPVLRATTNQVLVNQRTLICALGQGSSGVDHPQFLERDDGPYIEAHKFLQWLAHYVIMTRAEEIPFPNELARLVGDAVGLPAVRSPEPASFESLTLALEQLFDRALAELPETLRKRVEQAFLPLLWDNLDTEQRRSKASQWDYWQDPATEQDRQFWRDSSMRRSTLRKDIAQWEAATTPTAGDLAQKEARLAALRKELGRTEQEQRHRLARGDYYPERKRPDGSDGESSNHKTLPAHYIAYPKAMKLLAERLNATPEELAVWVFMRTKADRLNRLEQTPEELDELSRMGPKDYGLAAYLNANELDPPPRFYYSYSGPGDFDYLEPLMACWFREDDIATFQPVERYITGRSLIERWSTRPHIQPVAYILAKIRESRLFSLHPIFGGTQGSLSGDDENLPPLESGLFELLQVKKIEEEDFGEKDVSTESSAGPCEPTNAVENPHPSELAQAGKDGVEPQPGKAGVDDTIPVDHEGCKIQRVDAAVWSISFQGQEFFSNVSVGIRYLQQLLLKPRHVIEATTLYAIVSAPSVDDSPITNQQSDDQDLPDVEELTISRSDGAEPVLDERAVTELKARVKKLEDLIEDANAKGNYPDVEQYTDEKEKVQRELLSATKKGGGIRRLSNRTEKIRKSVRAAIQREIERIWSPALGVLHAHVLDRTDQQRFGFRPLLRSFASDVMRAHSDRLTPTFCVSGSIR